MLKLLFLTVILLTASATQAQEVDSSCLALADEFLSRVCPVQGQILNPFSVMIDTCSFGTFDTCSRAWVNRFAKNGFRVDFNNDIFRLPVYPADTDIEVSMDNIDTSFGFLRSVFDSIQQRCGNFMFHKLYPNDTLSEQLAGAYELRFNGYVNIHFIDTTFKNDRINYNDNLGPFVVNESVNEKKIPSPSFVPNPVHTTLNIELGNSMTKAADIFTDNGQLIRHYEFPYAISNFTLNFGGLAPGTYTVICQSQILRIVFNP